uniref:Peptidase S1 domain-containing protein n=1 Tax=Anopheles merus TaxID=30066 RepID=A0A182VGZ7_ANOME
MHRFSSTYYDIALMKLERNVTVLDTVAPTCLWLDDEIRFPELLAAGWGRTGFEYISGSVSKRCYKAGSPIVWRKALNDTGYVEYLVHLYSYGSCKSNIPRVVARVAAYIEWFKEVLQY